MMAEKGAGTSYAAPASGKHNTKKKKKKGGGGESYGA